MENSDKKARIMRAAEKLFLSRRFHEISIEDIARDAGIGKGTIYLYFKDKENLFFQTAVSGFDEMCDLLRSGSSREKDAHRKLLEALKKIDSFFKKRRPLIRMINSEWGRAIGRRGSLQEAWRERRKKMIGALADILEEDMASGEIRKDVSPMAMAEYLLGILRTRGDKYETLQGPDGSIEVLADLFMNGIRRRKKK